MALPPSVLLARGARRRCPVCGAGGLFRRWVRMRPACPGCGLRFQRAPGQWLGSWFLNVVLVQTVVVALLVLAVGLSWPHGPAPLALVGVAVAAVVVPLAFFPWSRTLWTAIDLIMRPLELDDGVAPGVELEQLDQLRRRRGPPRPREVRWGAPRRPARPPTSPGRGSGPSSSPSPGAGPHPDGGEGPTPA